jgi:hypothetical protein
VLINNLPRQAEDAPAPADADTAVADHLARAYLLLAPLLPPSFAAPNGAKRDRDAHAPGLLFAPDAAPQPTMELVRPGPRFGLLLVESAAG